jgi:hypothetical protein
MKTLKVDVAYPMAFEIFADVVEHPLARTSGPQGPRKRTVLPLPR